MKTIARGLLVLLIAAGALAPRIAFAACVGPAGAEGDMIYNSTHHMMQFCDNTNWIAMAGMSGGSSGSGDYTTGLVGHWKFDEGSGTTTADSSGNGNSGTLTNGPTWTTGVSGGAIHFDGTDDFVTMGSPAVLDDLTTMTVCAWANLDAWTAQWPGIVSKNDANGWVLYTSGGGGYTFGFDSRFNTGAGTDNSHGEAAQVTPGEWFMACATSDGTTAATGNKLYYARTWPSGAGVSGLYFPPQGTSSWGSTVSDAASILRVGADQYFQGIIDEVRIYNRTLSFEDITALYVATAP